MTQWILDHIQLFIISIVTPITGWLFVDRRKMTRELEAKDVAIESDKFDTIQKQIQVFEKIINSLKEDAEYKQKMYFRDIESMLKKIESMKQQHELERQNNINQILQMTREINRLREEIKKKQAECGKD